jgi:hypothetical protein
MDVDDTGIGGLSSLREFTALKALCLDAIFKTKTRFGL